jgi:hypothetical protein
MERAYWFIGKSNEKFFMNETSIVNENEYMPIVKC